MKKSLIKVLLIISICIFPWNTFALGGYSVSKSSMTITTGGTGSFVINATNAAGRANIVSSNPSVASVSTTAVFLDCNSSSITVTGHSAGTAVITITPYDMATFDEEVIENSYSIYVTVKSPSTPSVPSTPSTPSTGGTTQTDTRSTNTGLSKLTANGKELTNSNNKYTLEVSNYIEKIDIAATAADSKAKVSGTGNKELKVGENTFSIVVTAEKGNTTTYTVVITRKEYNEYSDIDELLKLDKDTEIKINDNDKLLKDDLEKIINSKNKITLNKISEDKKTLYSWILDGSKIKSKSNFNPNISTLIESNEKMEEALNYASGIYLDFSNCEDIPEGAVLKYYVGNKYKDGDKINLYIYDEQNDEVKQLESAILVKDGYIELKIVDSVKHIITKAQVVNATPAKEDPNIWFIISIVLIVIIIIMFISMVIGKNKHNKKNEDITPIETKTEMPQMINTNIEESNSVKKTEIQVDRNVMETPQIQATRDVPTNNSDSAVQPNVSTQPVINPLPETTTTVESNEVI